MVIFKNETLAVRRLEPDDFPLVAKWLSDSRVLEFYEGRDNPHDLSKVQRVFGSKQDRSVTACIVSHEGMDIGYIQFYPVAEPELSEYGLDSRDVVYGLDQFIGEPEYWNRGIGTTLVKSAAEYVRETLGANKVVMDPQAWNTRAIRCYEKAWFHKVKWLPKHEWHEGESRDCWLMAYTSNKEYITHDIKQ